MNTNTFLELKKKVGKEEFCDKKFGQFNSLRNLKASTSLASVMLAKLCFLSTFPMHLLRHKTLSH